ncbi:hypothetical protein RCL1_005821 [Eukaryota sp. TZLM3-RCL]
MLSQSSSAILINKLVNQHFLPSTYIPIDPQDRAPPTFWNKSGIVRAEPLTPLPDASINLAYSSTSPKLLDGQAASFLEAESSARVLIPENATLSTFLGRLKELTVSHSGVDFITKQLAQSSEAQKDDVFNEISESLVTLISHPFGHLLVRFFIQGSKYREPVFKLLSPHFEKLFQSDTSRSVLLYFFYLVSFDQKRILANSFVDSGVETSLIPENNVADVFHFADDEHKQRMTGTKGPTQIEKKWQQIQSDIPGAVRTMPKNVVDVIPSLTFSDVFTIISQLNRNLLDYVFDFQTVIVVKSLAQNGGAMTLYNSFEATKSWSKLVSKRQGQEILIAIIQHVLPFQVAKISSEILDSRSRSMNLIPELKDLLCHLPRTDRDIVKLTGYELLTLKRKLSDEFGIRSIKFDCFPEKLRDLSISGVLSFLHYFVSEPSTVDLTCELWLKSNEFERKSVLQGLDWIIQQKKSSYFFDNDCKFLVLLSGDPDFFPFLCQCVHLGIYDFLLSNTRRKALSRILLTFASYRLLAFLPTLLNWIFDCLQTIKLKERRTFHSIVEDELFLKAIYMSCSSKPEKTMAETLFGPPGPIPIAPELLETSQFKLIGSSAIVSSSFHPSSSKILISRLCGSENDCRSLIHTLITGQEIPSLAVDPIGSMVLFHIWKVIERPNHLRDVKLALLGTLKDRISFVLSNGSGVFLLSQMLINSRHSKEQMQVLIASILSDESCLNILKDTPNPGISLLLSCFLAIANENQYLHLLKFIPYNSLLQTTEEVAKKYSKDPVYSASQKIVVDRAKNYEKRGNYSLALNELITFIEVVLRQQPDWFVHLCMNCSDSKILIEIFTQLDGNLGQTWSLEVFRKLATHKNEDVVFSLLDAVKNSVAYMVKNPEFCNIFSSICERSPELAEKLLTLLRPRAFSYLLEFYSTHGGCRRVLEGLRRNVSTESWNELLAWAERDLIKPIIRNRGNIRFDEFWIRK